MTLLEVESLIKKHNTKSCELNIVLTHFLKDNLDAFLPIITKLVNLSLKHGIFANNWKLAILKPLLKQECLSVKGPPPAFQYKVKHLQFDLGMTLTTDKSN